MVLLVQVADRREVLAPPMDRRVVRAEALDQVVPAVGARRDELFVCGGGLGEVLPDLTARLAVREGPMVRTDRVEVQAVDPVAVLTAADRMATPVLALDLTAVRTAEALASTMDMMAEPVAVNTSTTVLAITSVPKPDHQFLTELLSDRLPRRLLRRLWRKRNLLSPLRHLLTLS